MTAQAERNALDLGGVRQVLLRVGGFSLLFESITAVVVSLRLWITYDEPIGTAAYHGLFHAVSAFNNAGFSLYSDNLIGFVTDPVICLTIAATVILGGIGFPVLNELKGNLGDPTRWTLHTKLTLVTTAALLAVGTLAFMAFEWTNPDTFGDLTTGESLLASFFQGVQPRTAGFNSIDTAALNDSTLLVSSALMLVGRRQRVDRRRDQGDHVRPARVRDLVRDAGATRGDPLRPARTEQRSAPGALGRPPRPRRGGRGHLRPALGGRRRMGSALYESFSAFGTVGLSTGITPSLPRAGPAALMGLMFLGRVGPITLFRRLGAAPAAAPLPLPRGRPIIG
jgi:Trk-type K+ transport system membrane component